MVVWLLAVGLVKAAVVSADPLDPNIAAGPDTLVVTRNFTISLRTKDAPNVETAFRGLVDFFAASDVTFDPRVIFDPHARRFMAIAASAEEKPTAMLHLAVSKSDRPRNLNTGPDASADWFVFTIDPDPTGTPSAFHWLDFPQIGVDASYVYITGRLAPGAGPPTYITRLWVIPTADLVAGGPIAPAVLGTPMQPIADSVITPTINFDGDGELITDNSSAPSGTFSVLRVTATGGVPSIARTDVPVPTVSPAIVCNAVGVPVLMGNHIHAPAVQRGGRLWVAYVVGDGARDAIRWLELDAATATLLQIGTIRDDATCLGYPAIQVDGDNDAWFVMAGLRNDLLPSIFASVRLSADPDGTTRPIVLLKRSRGRFFSSTLQRWADFGGIATDPVTDTMWGLHQVIRPDYPYEDVWADRIGATLPVSARKVLLRDSGTRQGGTIRSMDPAIRTSWWDPATFGATIVIYNPSGGDHACVSLPSAGWTRSSGGFRFRGSLVAGSPVPSITLRDGMLSVRVRGDAIRPFTYTLNEPSQGQVAFQISSSGLSLCGLAGGTVLADQGGVRGGIFNARRVPMPAACASAPPCT